MEKPSDDQTEYQPPNDSIEYQRQSWEALRNSINGAVNNVTATNITEIVHELFNEINLIRGMGLFCRACIKTQMASPLLTHIIAALVAMVNGKLPEIGLLLLKMIIMQLRRAYMRKDKAQLMVTVKFIAHLVNHEVAHEKVALELLKILLQKPTNDDSVEVAVEFAKECGSRLQDVSSQGLDGVFERLRGLLDEGVIDKRVQFLIEELFAVRSSKFSGFPAVHPELALVAFCDQVAHHEVSLHHDYDDEIGENCRDVFEFDPNFLENERLYENELKMYILGGGGDTPLPYEEDEDEDEDDQDEDEEVSDTGSVHDGKDDEEYRLGKIQVKDATKTNRVDLVKTLYRTIMSSLDFEEVGNKLQEIMNLETGQEMELCIIVLERCSQEKIYRRFYGHLGKRFCRLSKVYQDSFEKCFKQHYSLIHKFETNRIRNLAMLFADLLAADALPWQVLGYLRLTKQDTTAFSLIFITTLFQELSDHLGLRLLKQRLDDPAMQGSIESIFPKNSPENIKFSINFFTSIGLGGIAEPLREYLKNMHRTIMQQQKSEAAAEGSDSCSSSSEGGDNNNRKRRKLE